jgi:signal transduction histidine kinase
VDSPGGETDGEIRQLRRCINDLVSITALPAIWAGAEPPQIVDTLLDALHEVLQPDLIYLRAADPFGGTPVESVRAGRTRTRAVHEIAGTLETRFGDDPARWPARVPNPLGGEDLSIVPAPLGLDGHFGLMLVGSSRADFPRQTERLLLNVAANQAAVGLQEARLLNERKRAADDLDQRVRRRTAELADLNQALTTEVAERRRAEEALRRSEAFLAEGQRLSGTGTFLWRLDTNQILFSEEMNRVFEFDQQSARTLEQVVERIHPEDRSLFFNMVASVRFGQPTRGDDIRLQLPNASVKYLHTMYQGVSQADGGVEVLGAVMDFTQRWLSEQALDKVRSELAHLARVSSLGALTASIAHEVNQPLSGIITNASTCLRMLAADPPNIAGASETARRMIRDGNRAADVIQRLRVLFVKREAAFLEPVDLNDAAREVVALSRGDLQVNGVVVRLELTDDLPLVAGDRVQLQQVMLNLVRNASEAMNDVGDGLRQIVISTELDGDHGVCFAVRDAGPGFDPQLADRLFDPFYSTKAEGMGMGLSVSRSIIESHRGRLWAIPNQGSGATFLFSLPRRPT